MRQVIYTDIDEEIIAVIGKLRKSPARENALMLPKRALVLQSIVNLRLLQREAEKLGKSIILVTQDEQGRLLAEKSGIPTQSFLEESPENARYDNVDPQPVVADEEKTAHAEKTPASDYENQSKSRGFGEGKIQSVKFPRSDAVGSASFFSVVPSAAQTHVAPAPASRESVPVSPKKILVKDFSPKNLTALNSKLTAEGAATVVPSVQPTVSGVPKAESLHALPAYFNQSQGLAKASSQQHSFAALAQQSAQSHHVKEPKKTVAVKVPGGGRWRGVFLVFGLVSVLSLGGVGAYLFLPKADIVLKPKAMHQEVDIEFQGSEGARVSFESKTIPVRFIDGQGVARLSFDATGTASLADKKARGQVTIYNEYSSASQTLVASTRLLSSDGKLFRLVGDVTVPGIAGDAPGAIEANVVADQPGAEYNISPTTFTIPGFQGSPKYAKFSAKSTQVMTGGGIGGGDTKSVSEEDIRKAKKATEAAIKEAAQDTVKEKLLAGEQSLPEAIESTIVSSAPSIPLGSAAQSFDYEVKFSVRALVFSEEDFKKSLGEMFLSQNKDKGNFSVDSIDLEYGLPTPDFSARTLRVKAHASAVMSSLIDTDRVKQDLLGKGQDEIGTVIRKYPQIDRATVTFWPEFFVTRVPNNSQRVTITSGAPGEPK